MRRLWIAACLTLAIYLVAAGAVALAGLHDHVTTADIIVVPGNTVQADGSPSERRIVHMAGFEPVILSEQEIGVIDVRLPLSTNTPSSSQHG